MTVDRSDKNILRSRFFMITSTNGKAMNSFSRTSDELKTVYFQVGYDMTRMGIWLILKSVSFSQNRFWVVLIQVTFSP